MPELSSLLLFGGARILGAMVAVYNEAGAFGREAIRETLNELGRHVGSEQVGHVIGEVFHEEPDYRDKLSNHHLVKFTGDVLAAIIEHHGDKQIDLTARRTLLPPANQPLPPQ
ncbi:MAG: hypothetical protein K1X78_23395 [Verrucomicrobiaceae bacterium]|nr:hypothetical protein [Verrucomicrobiaceae bacterium]